MPSGRFKETAAWSPLGTWLLGTAAAFWWVEFSHPRPFAEALAPYAHLDAPDRGSGGDDPHQVNVLGTGCYGPWRRAA